MPNKGETLLRVEHLCQYFKTNKAVDDVSFEIKKGEVFGLVGESGCGKTTTGRSIIKLYDITSGDIYFKGERIAAGTLSYRNHIKEAKKKYKEEAEALKIATAAEKIQAAKALEEAYAAAPFVRLLGRNQPADTKNVTRTNCVDIGWAYDPRTNRVILMSAEDNVVKGAGGQAVQSFNIMCGFDETEGLWVL